MFDIFMKFNALVENQSSNGIKVLINDGGGDCTSKAFESFYDDQGIQNEVTTPYTPQLNDLN